MVMIPPRKVTDEPRCLTHGKFPRCDVNTGGLAPSPYPTPSRMARASGDAARAIQVNAAEGNWPILIGETYMGSNVFACLLHDTKYFDVVFVHSIGPIESVSKISQMGYPTENQIQSGYYTKYEYQAAPNASLKTLGQFDQLLNGHIAAEHVGFTERLPGLAHTVIHVDFGDYPSLTSLNDFLFKIKGVKGVYDPRTGTTGTTACTNPALMAAFLMANKTFCGGIPSTHYAPVDTYDRIYWGTAALETNSVAKAASDLEVADILESGTGTGSSGLLTDGTQSWDVDKWIGYTLIDSAGTRFAITDSTATTVSVSGTPASGAYSICAGRTLNGMLVRSSDLSDALANICGHGGMWIWDDGEYIKMKVDKAEASVKTLTRYLGTPRVKSVDMEAIPNIIEVDWVNPGTWPDIYVRNTYYTPEPSGVSPLDFVTAKYPFDLCTNVVMAECLGKRIQRHNLLADKEGTCEVGEEDLGLEKGDVVTFNNYNGLADGTKGRLLNVVPHIGRDLSFTLEWRLYDPDIYAKVW